MKFNKAFVVNSLILAVYLCSSTVYGEEDITAKYLKNPSFEEDDISTLEYDATRNAYIAEHLIGWELEGLEDIGSCGVSDIMNANTTATDNDFGPPGEPSDGKQMYYLRNAWTQSEILMYQVVILPAGNYKLSVNNKCVTKPNHQAYLMAGENEIPFIFENAMPEIWNKTSLYFNVKEEKEMKIGVRTEFINAAGASILLDNFHLYSDPKSEEEISNEEKNAENEDDKFSIHKGTGSNKDSDSGIENIKIFSLNSLVVMLIVTCWMYIWY